MAVLAISVGAMATDEQTVSMTTARSVGQSLTLVVNRGAGVSVDWGDGQPVAYATDTIQGTVRDSVLTLTGSARWTTLACEGADLTALDVSGATGLTTLFCGDNRLTSLSVNRNRALTDLDCHNNHLKQLNTRNCSALVYLNCAGNEIASLYSTTSNNPELQVLVCDSNQLTSLSLNSLTALRGLWCGGNSISSLTLSRPVQLGVVACDGNQLTSLRLGANDSLAILWADGNRLTSLDLSTAPALTTLSCAHNRLTSITYNEPSSKNDYDYMNIASNNLLFSSMVYRTRIANYATHFVYAPQGIYSIPAAMDVSDTLDLTSTRLNAEGRAVTAYRVIEVGGNQLTAGTDYRLINSQKIKFLKVPADSVYIEMISNRSYPGLTIQTTAMRVTDRVPVQRIETPAAGLSLQIEAGAVSMSAAVLTPVRIYTSDGVLRWSGLVGSTPKRVLLPQGIYIVNNRKISIVP